MKTYKSDVYKSEEAKKTLQKLYDKQLASISVPYQEKIVDTRFGKTHVVIYGNEAGVPVFGFHGGNTTNPYSLRPFLKHVDMNTIKFIVPDTIGNIGYSSEHRISSANLDYGKWASDILDGLHIDKISVFGGSYGGGIAIRLATYAPKRITKMMLMVPSGIANANLLHMAHIGIPTLSYMLKPTNDEKLKRAVSSMAPEVNDDFLEMIKLAVTNTKFEMAMPRNVKKKELEELKAPVYIMAEKYDCLFPGEKVLERAKQVFPNLVATKLLTLGGHGAFMIHEERHHEFYDEITHFFTEYEMVSDM